MNSATEQFWGQENALNTDILEENNAYAAENRQLFQQAGVFTLSVMGTPGSGKTTLLERMLRLMQQRIRVAVIEGDSATAKDARRLADCGVSVIQINSAGGGCLDALMINKVLPGFYLEDIDLLIIENVGRLMQTAPFDLGEDLRLMVMSVAEGCGKPAKYPAVFGSSHIAVLNKMDMLEKSGVNLEETERGIVTVSPEVKLFHTCCRKGEVQGVDKLADYLIKLTKNKRSAREG